ncbi:MAG: hsp70-interacting protein [Bacillariaceae sp.]|jgi:hsp70-interacting protein
MSTGGKGGGDPWAWLGLLKWTLAHSDGTKPSDPAKIMSDEDRAFLEMVMKEGIIDENERMKIILEEFSKAMEYYKIQAERLTKIDEDQNDDDDDDDVAEKEEEEKEKDAESSSQPIPNDEALEELLQELRDIVEQVDYARAFVSLKGCSFLLGAISAMSSSSSSSSSSLSSSSAPTPIIPEPIRNICLGILSTLAQNNPPVQKELLEIGALKTLSDMFLLDSSTTSLSTKTKIMQSVSAIVRNCDLTEAVFEQLPQAPVLMVQGLSSDPEVSNVSLRTKTLFFLRAYLTSDNATPERAKTFSYAIALVADPQYLNDNGEDDGAAITLRESSIALLQQLLERRMAVTLLLQRKNILASLGVERIKNMRALTGDDADRTKEELHLWETFLVLLARTEPEEEILDN